MTAQCMTCGKLRPWRATRGARLSDARCTCGGEMELSTARFAGAVLRFDGKLEHTWTWTGRKTGKLGWWPPKEALHGSQS